MPLSKAERRKRNAARTRQLYATSEKYRKQQKNTKLMKAYGITLEQYEEWNKHNNGLCHICNKEEIAIDKKTGKRRMLAVDHDENTGLVRGLLCSICNRGIGMLKHDIQILQEATEYLSYFNSVTMPEVLNAVDPR